MFFPEVPACLVARRRAPELLRRITRRIICEATAGPWPANAMALSNRRLPPTQSAKLGKVAVIRDPNAGMFNGERRKPSVRNLRASNLRFAAQSLENRPMPLTRLDDLAMRLTQQIIAKGENTLDWTGMKVGARIGRNPHHRAQHQRGKAEPGLVANNAVEPRLAYRVARRVRTECMDQYVDVGEDQGNRRTYARSSISCKADESSMSTPGSKPPVAVQTGGSTRSAGSAVRLSLTTRRKPSSISAVSERPSAAALRLARKMRSAGSRTVVRSIICHDIRPTRGYVKGRRGYPPPHSVLLPGVLQLLVPQHGERAKAGAACGRITSSI